MNLPLKQPIAIALALLALVLGLAACGEKSEEVEGEALPFSLTLDPNIGAERFFAVFAEHPARLQKVRDAAERVAQSDIEKSPTLTLPRELSQSSVLIELE